ncbi:MAG: SRPBCC family protein [Chloroflexota bacterium]
MRQFKHEQATHASKATIWDIWRDVDNWPEWDIELEYATLLEDFAVGVVGTLKAKNAPESRFEITELTEGESFTFIVRLPLARLEIAHYFVDGEQTIFVHDVAFRGPLGWLFGMLLGQQYATALPQAMELIQLKAEGNHKIDL